MKIAIFGASGKTGRHLVTQALAAGHEVVAAVRNVESMNGIDGNLIPIQCDVSADVDMEVFSIHPDIEQVVIALGAKELWGNTVRSVGTGNIVRAIKAAGLSPQLWVISAAGIDDSWLQLSWLSKLFAKLLLPAVMREHAAQEAIVTGSGLRYSILRPSGLTDADESAYHIVPAGTVMLKAQISRQALAKCVFDNVGDEGFVNRALTVTGG